jgi:hypothetical protein
MRQPTTGGGSQGTDQQPRDRVCRRLHPESAQGVCGGDRPGLAELVWMAGSGIAMPVIAHYLSHSDSGITAIYLWRRTRMLRPSKRLDCPSEHSARPDQVAGITGRSERIRTSGPCVPNTVLYQAELHSGRVRAYSGGPSRGQAARAERPEEHRSRMGCFLAHDGAGSAACKHGSNRRQRRCAGRATRLPPYACCADQLFARSRGSSRPWSAGVRCPLGTPAHKAVPPSGVFDANAPAALRMAGEPLASTATKRPVADIHRL